MSDVKITPEPTDEEAAAVVAALAAWPQTAPPTDVRPPRWRFSGRWWSQPIPMRRRRPW